MASASICITCTQMKLGIANCRRSSAPHGRRKATARSRAKRKKAVVGSSYDGGGCRARDGRASTISSHRQSKHLTDRDTIVLADFANSTGDAVFDDTLKTALTVSLRQSPFLNVLSDSEVAKTLQD